MKCGMNTSGMKMAWLAGLAGLAVSASAQMTVPPADKPAPWPAETKTAPVETKHETISVQEAIRRGLMEDPNKPKTAAPAGATPAAATPAATPAQAPAPEAPTMSKEQMRTNYPAWERDGSGRVLPLDRPVHWAAIDRNKTITPENRKKIEIFLNQRRVKLEEAILANMANVLELDSGIVETIKMSDRADVNKLLAANKPFSDLGVFANELRKADLFTQNNIQQHNIIVDDYRRLMLDDMKRDSGSKANEKNGTVDFVSRAMFFTLTDEPRQIYHWMLEDSAETAADRVSSLGLSSDVEPKVREFFQQAKDSKDESERLAKMRSAVALMTPDQVKTLVAPVVNHGTTNAAAPAAKTGTPANATSDASKAGDR